MPVTKAVIEAFSDKDRLEIERWAAMAGMRPEEYLQACIRKGHEIIGRRTLDTPTFKRERYASKTHAESRVPSLVN